MPTNVTHFEIELPLQSDPVKVAAIEAFRSSMVTLCPIYQLDLYKYVMDSGGNISYSGQSSFMSGYITVAQQATALSFLTILNTALGQNVLCTIHTVTIEP